MRARRVLAAIVLGLASAAPGAAGTTKPAAKVPKSAPQPLTGLAADQAFAAFDDGKYLTALDLAKKQAAQGEAAAHTLVGRILAEDLKKGGMACVLAYDTKLGGPVQDPQKGRFGEAGRGGLSPGRHRRPARPPRRRRRGRGGGG